MGLIFASGKVLKNPTLLQKVHFKFFLGVIENERGFRTMRSIDCYQCAYNHWGIGLGLGDACVHPDNQKYNPKQCKEGDEKTYWNSTTQVSRIPDGCELRKERD